MPTPRPIIAVICGPNSGIEKPCEASPTMAMPMPRPISAVVIGRPMAITEPNARSRMTMAASTPSSSLAGNSNFWNTWPP